VLALSAIWPHQLFSAVAIERFKMVFTRKVAGALLGLAVAARDALAQFPPPLEGVTVLKSRFDPDITISYKEV
jgi:hypothetical protein